MTTANVMDVHVGANEIAALRCRSASRDAVRASLIALLAVPGVGLIATAAMAHHELVLRLRSGIELRLGRPTDVRLKLAVARRALRGLPSGAAYLDVSVPGRPVAGTQPSTLR